MIKRRFYKLEHGDRDAPSESSSSSSGSELEAEATDRSDGEEEEEDANAELIKKDEFGFSSSGYESEDSSAHEVNLDSSGLPTSDEDVGPQRDRQSLVESHLFGRGNTDLVDLQPNAVAEKDAMARPDFADYVVKHKSVFKCKLCPRIVCLLEETINAHIKSKRHARSEKLLKEGRLKFIVDKVGKFEDVAAPTVASEEKSSQSRRKKRGWRGQKKRKKREQLSIGDARESTKNKAKKRHKGDK